MGASRCASATKSRLPCTVYAKAGTPILHARVRLRIRAGVRVRVGVAVGVDVGVGGGLRRGLGVMG